MKLALGNYSVDLDDWHIRSFGSKSIFAVCMAKEFAWMDITPGLLKEKLERVYDMVMKE